MMLDYEVFADERRIKEALAKLGIGSLVCCGQLWVKVASAGRKKRRRDGGRGINDLARIAFKLYNFQYNNRGLGAFVHYDFG